MSYKRRPDWILQVLQNGNLAALIPIRGGAADLTRVHELNHAGIEIWNRMSRPVTESELVELLGQFYDAAEPSRLRNDVRACMKSLLKIGAAEKA